MSSEHPLYANLLILHILVTNLVIIKAPHEKTNFNIIYSYLKLLYETTHMNEGTGGFLQTDASSS
jgi:hypothetical protein